MSINTEKIKIMRDEKISTALLKLSIPAIIGMLINALYNVVDAYFVGSLGTSEIGAVAVVFPLVMLIIGIGLVFGNGAAMSISRLLGEEDYEKANITASTALFGSIIAGIMATLISLLFLNKLLLILGATTTIFPYARGYAVIYLGGCVLQVFCITMNNLVISEGNVRVTMFAMLIGGGLNIVLDPIFIYTFGWGVEGAALATITSQGIVALIYLWYILSGKGVLRISLAYFKPIKEIVGTIIKLGIPVFLMQLLSGVGMGLINTAASRYGDAAVGAMGVVMRIIALASYVVFGYAKGFQPIVGFNYGAGRYDRLNMAIATSLKWVLIFCAIVTAVLILFAKDIMRLFSTDIELISIGVEYLQINGAVFILFGCIMIYSTLFLAIGNAKKGSLMILARQGIFFIPAIFILPYIFGLAGVIYAQPVADIFAFVLVVVFGLPLQRRLRTA